MGMNKPEPMTVTALAARLLPISGTSVETLQRQLRSWTEAGALFTTDGVFVGTGKARVYSEEAAFAAVVAVALARWGSSIGAIRTVLFGLQFSLGEEHSMARKIKEGRSDALLV